MSYHNNGYDTSSLESLFTLHSSLFFLHKDQSKMMKTQCLMSNASRVRNGTKRIRNYKNHSPFSSSSLIVSSCRSYTTRKRPLVNSIPFFNQHHYMAASTETSPSLNYQQCLMPSTHPHNTNFRRHLTTSTTTSSSSSSSSSTTTTTTTTTTATTIHKNNNEEMDSRQLYRYLQLEQFSQGEIHRVFQRIQQSTSKRTTGVSGKPLLLESSLWDDFENETKQQKQQSSTRNSFDNEQVSTTATTPTALPTDTATIYPTAQTISYDNIVNYLMTRIQDMEQEQKEEEDQEEELSASSSSFSSPSSSTSLLSDQEIHSERLQYAQEEASKIMNVFVQQDSTTTTTANNNTTTSFQSPARTTTISKDDFTMQLLDMSSTIDYKRTIPIAVSMLLVGSSVGIVTPVMPFVVEQLGLTPGQYGMVVSAFALAKMVGNVPSAIAVEYYGRKPYLVYSLSVIALGVGGIGLATQFEHLYVCRLMTGLGVAALSTAATLTMSDISTPRNRATTMAPIMSAFAAGTALGPAMGGLLADSVGISPTFYIVGCSYLGLTVVNHMLLTETKTQPMVFPWQLSQYEKVTSSMKTDDASPSTSTSSSAPASLRKTKMAIQNALGQWIPLLSDDRVRNVVIMNGFYWFSLAGSQMTLLPLMLTDPHGLAMTATSVGKVYMGMSLVQVLGNPTLAKFVDSYLGKGPAIVGGCTLISSAMVWLPYACQYSASTDGNDLSMLAYTLGIWALGSTMLSTAPVAYISDTVDETKRAQAIALLRTMGDVGFLLGASTTGALADWTGGNLDIAMQSSAGLLCTATTWFASRQYYAYYNNLQRQQLSTKTTTKTHNDKDEGTKGNN